MKVFASLLLLASYASAIYLKVEVSNTAHIDVGEGEDVAVNCEDPYQRDSCHNLCWRYPELDDELSGEGWYYVIDGTETFIFVEEWKTWESCSRRGNWN